VGEGKERAMLVSRFMANLSLGHRQIRHRLFNRLLSACELAGSLGGLPDSA
jgi:hypothetical protein